MMKKINDNAYQIYLRGKYGVGATFNIYDLTPFDADNELTGFKDTNPSKGEEWDMNQDVLVLSLGPITHSRDKKL